MIKLIRTYESFSIAWADGSRWSGYDSAAEAQSQLDNVTHFGELPVAPRLGTVERRTFDVEIEPARVHLYQPGIADRWVHDHGAGVFYVSYVDSIAGRLIRSFATRELAQEFVDVNALVYPLPGCRLIEPEVTS